MNIIDKTRFTEPVLTEILYLYMTVDPSVQPMTYMSYSSNDNVLACQNLDTFGYEMERIKIEGTYDEIVSYKKELECKRNKNYLWKGRWMRTHDTNQIGKEKKPEPGPEPVPENE